MSLLHCSQGLCFRVFVTLTVAVFKVQAGDPWGSQRPFQGLCKVKTIFLKMLSCCLFHSHFLTSVQWSFPEVLV